MDWAGRRVLVTGGAGFLGSTLCHALVERDSYVTVVDSFLEYGGAHADNLAGAAVTLVREDLRTAELAPLLGGQELIFNLAAQTGHMRGQRRPEEDLEINALAQVRLIEAIREHAPEAVVVHASTRQIYGRSAALPVGEDALPAPPDANAIAKLAGEQYWMMEHRVHGLPVVALRLTNCYGPRQRIRDAEQSFVGSWIGKILRDEPFEVWDGRQQRDLCFVDDAVAALLLAATTPGCRGRMFNVGGASSLSLLRLAEHFRAETGCAFTVRPMPPTQASIDMGSYVADDSRFREATGWSPLTGLVDGIAATLAWYRPRAAAYLG